MIETETEPKPYQQELEALNLDKVQDPQLKTFLTGADQSIRVMHPTVDLAEGVDKRTFAKLVRVVEPKLAYKGFDQYITNWWERKILIKEDYISPLGFYAKVAAMYVGGFTNPPSADLIRRTIERMGEEHPISLCFKPPEQRVKRPGIEPRDAGRTNAHRAGGGELTPEVREELFRAIGPEQLRRLLRLIPQGSFDSVNRRLWGLPPELALALFEEIVAKSKKFTGEKSSDIKEVLDISNREARRLIIICLRHMPEGGNLFDL